MNSRVQLTLFVPGPAAGTIEAVRKLLDPVQVGLIAAHVTLCREDELERLGPEVLLRRLLATQAQAVSLGFGPPEPFGSHGVLLPCVSGEEEFQELRRQILGSGTIRKQVPHMTLAHPRNPKAPGNSLANAAILGAGMLVKFSTVSRIDQHGTSPWRVLQQIDLPAGKSGDT